MTEVKEYYVVGLYTNEDEPPHKIYKVTTDVDVAINTYEVHFENSNCYIGTYVNNKLVELGKLYSRRANGPGIFNGAVTTEAIEHYTID